MLDVLNYRSGTLKPTATYQRRAWLWIPGADPVTDPLGRLTIQLQHGRRSSAKMEQDDYLVEEVAPDRGPGRAFLLLNLTDETQKDVYRVEILHDERLDYCKCTAADCKVPTGCKHRHTLRHLIEEGIV